MSKFFQRIAFCLALVVIPVLAAADDFQLPDPGFEDWSGSTFDGNVQPKYWHASNVEQSAIGLTFRFNFAHKESGRNGGTSLMVQDQEVGAAGITEVSPGYFSLGYAWQYLDGLNTNSATAGTKGGIGFKHRPDSISVWIRRTGNNTDKEDFHILFYSWTGTAKGTSYKAKNQSCTSTTVEDEESDIRIALNGNECKTATAGTQIAEGWLHTRAQYNNWTNVRIPIYYMRDEAPTKCNVIFSASNYPNYRANSGLYEGNSLYVDDIELIYSSKIDVLRIGGKEWKGFDPNTTDVQVYSVPEGTTVIPSIEAYRGAGSLTNVEGLSTTKTVDFSGRKLSGSEITIKNGTVGGDPVEITVRAEDGSSTTTYKILFQAAKSSNAKLANLRYTYTNINDETVEANVPGFTPGTYNYKVELPYGAKGVPVIAADTAEFEQRVELTQATSLTGTATAVVTAANGMTKATYKVTFSVGALADNTLKDITVNGSSIPGFTPSQAVYKVSLPVGTTQMPEVKAVSAYPEGEQTIVYKAPAVIDGGTYTVSVSTPGNTVAKVYKLNFKLEASSYSYLKDLKAGNYITNFEPTQTTYYVHLPLGTTELPEVTWEAGDEFQKIVKSDLAAGALDGTVRITVTAGNGDQTVYKIVFSTEKSDRSTLAGIQIGGVALENFDPDVTNYTYQLETGTTELPEITWTPGDEWQTVVLTTAGVNGKTRLTVTAGDGSITIYQIAFSVDAYTDNTLKALSVAGYSLQDKEGGEAAFDPEVNEYWVNLPQGTTGNHPEVSYELQSETMQTANVRDFTGSNGDYKLTIRPQSGSSRTYIIHFSVATSDNADLAMIYINGVEIPGFRPDSLDYRDSLPVGSSVIPAVTYDKGDANQRVLSVLEGKTQKITVTAESGKKQIYTVRFIPRASANAYLEWIELDGVRMAAFSPKTLEYTVEIKGDRCPAITVGKAAGQQVTVTAPYSTGDATIVVKPEDGDPNTYTIHFVDATAASALLANIALDGTSIPNFKADSMNYEAEYSDKLPAITYTKKDASQKVDLLWKDNVAWLYVTDAEGNQAAYNITFTRLYSSDNTLEGIYADGTLIAGFNPATLTYTYELEPGASYPTLTYKAKENTQVVFFGQLAEGKWGITVVSEDQNAEAATYTVVYTFKKYSDIYLKDLAVEGYPFAYSETTTTYGKFTIDEGAALPAITAVPKEGQSVIKYNENDSIQKVLVMAENGATNIYTIEYTRVKSNNVKLANIYVDGTPLFGFNPEITEYTYTLPRTATVVPNVNPVAQLPNQTVTTYFSQPGGETKIHVVAQDGSTGDYTIKFPVELSDNTLLKRLIINEELKDVNTTEYTFNVPFGTVNPYDVKYEIEEGQLVHFVDAPLSGVTKIIVTNEKGDNSRTYTIAYNVAVPQGQNKVAKVKYEYVNAADATVEGELEPLEGDNIINLPYGAKSFTVTEVVKSYAEQTIQFYNGGIRRGATIIAVSNRADEDDVEYTITPKKPEFDTTGKLKELKFNGSLVQNFRPDVYNYIINVTAQPTAEDFAYSAYDGAGVTVSAVNAQKKQITFTVAGGETYSVCWFYYEDEAPFTFDWEKTKDNVTFYRSSLTGRISTEGTKKSTGYRPHGWTVPADLFAGIIYEPVVSTFTYYTGKEVTRINEKEAILATIRGGALNSSIPGVMTLGALNLPNGVKIGGDTKVSFTRDLTVGATYRNTPQQFKFDYQPIMSYGISKFHAWIALGENNTKKIEHQLEGSYSNLGKWGTITQNLSYNFTVQKMNILLCSSEINGSSLSIYDGSESKSCDLQIRNIRFVYDSELTSATVNGKNAVKSGNTFTYTLADGEVIVGTPALKFTGAVHDQTQTIEWLNNGEWIDGELKAKVVNYGENALVEGRDSTIYTVVLKRAAEISVEHTSEFSTLAAINDTIFVNLPYGTKKLPDLTITPHSTHQVVSMTKKRNAVTVKVTAENGDEKTTVYVFREIKESDAELESFDAEDKNGNTVAVETVDAGTYQFKVVADEIPTINYTKKTGQAVDINYTKNGVTMLVTAADGATQITYTINREDPAVATSGQISEFAKDGNEWGALGLANYETTEPKPDELISFTRKDAKDSVVYVQAPTKMEWQVYGSENHTYVLNYPSEKSNNAELAGYLVGGEAYEDFSTDFIITSDTMIVLDAVGAEAGQQIVTVQTSEEGEIVVYETTVTAEDGTTRKTYKATVRRPRSENNLLAGIYLDDELIADFDPMTNNYTVTLPTPAVKTVQPQMPSITYEAGQAGQKIELTPGQLNGEDTQIEVESETGSKNIYSVKVEAAKSACVDLTGITVNGEMVDQFESGRHYYSVSLATNTIKVDYLSDDRFQTVSVNAETIREDHQYRYTLNVQAENGDEANYEVMIYVENLSNDAQLANITLNGKNFEDFERLLNEDLRFDPGQNYYEINLPSGTTVWPEVSAQLKMAGQSVEISHHNDSIVLDVKAVDNTPNRYVLRFLVPKSKNANLSMIFLDGEPLASFLPEDYVYQITLPEGVHELPEVAAQKGDAGQEIDEVIMDLEKNQATINVRAEDRSYSRTYVTVFQFTQSDADTLRMIYEDGKEMVAFQPQTNYYQLSLPVGTTAFPDLSWEEGNEWQAIKMDTVDATTNNLVRQIIVTSESRRTRTYTVSYTIEKSDVDTLQMIFVDQKQMEGFEGSNNTYSVTLSAAYANELNGQLPQVDYIAGDEYQTVMISQMPEDELTNKSLGYKSIITVAAASGKTRTYTIHYPVELSTDATLNMINIANKPLTGFDAERFNYRLEIEKEADVPVVSVIKKEDAQTYEIRVMNDTVQIVVWAESLVDSATYTLSFERLKSAQTALRDIILTGIDGEKLPSSEFPYRPEVYSYIVNIPYNANKPLVDLLPEIEPVFYDEEQTADTTLHYLPNGDIQIDVTVTAPNGEDQAIYSITFHLIRPSDATILSISIRGEVFDEFRPSKTEYTYAHPYGTDPADYFTQEDIAYVLSDTLAVDTIYTDDEGVITIMVTAQDGRTSLTYLISQITAEDGDNALAWITVNGDTLAGFDPDITFYTYYIFATDMPSVDAAPRSENAEVDKGRVSAGDTCRIICTAADGSERLYLIHFAITPVDPGVKATSGDVLIKRVPGSMQLVAYSVRQGVSIVLYDQYGHLLFTDRVPVANPNSTEIVTDADKEDFLNNVSDTGSGLIIDVLPGQPYFYTFYYEEKEKLASGKIMCY